MSTPTGVGYTAKLDGKGHPVKGSDTYNSSSLKCVDDHTITIEETHKRDGKVLSLENDRRASWEENDLGQYK